MGAVGPAGGCRDKSIWTSVLEPYLQLSDNARHERLAEWYLFCEGVARGAPQNASELANSWRQFTTFTPLDESDDCSMGAPQTTACILGSLAIIAMAWVGGRHFRMKHFLPTARVERPA